MEKQKREKVVSFRLSEQEYARDLSMAKLWYENDLINKPDYIVHSCINGVPRAVYHFLNPSRMERMNRMNSSKRKKEAWNGRILLSCNDPSVFNGSSISDNK